MGKFPLRCILAEFMSFVANEMCVIKGLPAECNELKTCNMHLVSALRPFALLPALVSAYIAYRACECVMFSVFVDFF